MFLESRSLLYVCCDAVLNVCMDVLYIYAFVMPCIFWDALSGIPLCIDTYTFWVLTCSLYFLHIVFYVFNLWTCMCDANCCELAISNKNCPILVFFFFFFFFFFTWWNLAKILLYLKIILRFSWCLWLAVMLPPPTSNISH